MSALANRIVGEGSEAPDQLLANPRNWRIHPQAQQKALSAVLEQVGWVQRVIVNRTTGYVVDGHLRVALAISRGEATIPVTYVELTPEEEALVLASLDPLAGMAVTDQDMFRELTGDLSVTDADLAALLGLDGPEGNGVDPDEVPDVPEVPTTKPGDLWLMGEHRLLCGDSTDAGSVALLMDGRRVECMWTDPPYGVAYVGKTKDALRLKNDDAAGLAGLLDGFLKVAGAEALTPGAAFYIARPAGAPSVVFGKAIEDNGWRLHEELQWVKDSMVLGHSDYHLKHETIMYGYLPGEGRFGRGGKGWHGDDSQTSVFAVDRPKASPDHPTGKPIDLIVPMLLNSSERDGLVYEPFAGSGSTLIAAEQTNRACYAMEIDPAYCDVICERWSRLTGGTPVLA